MSVTGKIIKLVEEELKNENALSKTLDSATNVAKKLGKNIGDEVEDFVDRPVKYAAGEILKDGPAAEALRAATDLFLRIAESKIKDLLVENADDIASQVVPDIPFDGDVIEGLMQRKFSEIIVDQADEIAAMVVSMLKERYLSALSSDTNLQEALHEAVGPGDDPVEAAEDAIESMDDSAQDKILNTLLAKIGADDLQEAKGNPVLKTLLNLPGGRDLAAMYMAITDRGTPKKLRILAAFAILNLISPVDVGTFMGLDFLGPLGAIDDIILLRRMFKKFEKAGLPSEKHHDKLQLAAGEDLSADRSAEVELDKTRDLAGARQTAAGSREKLRKLEEHKMTHLKESFARFLVKE